MSGSIKINGTTSGSTTITAPATGSDETIELSTALASKLDIGGGKVLQVVSAINTTTVSTTSTSVVTTNLTASITPSSTSNKVLVLCHIPIEHDGQLYSGALVSLHRGTVATTALFDNVQFDAENVNASTISYMYIDSPSTVSSQVYTVGIRTASGLVTVKSCPSGRLASMVLMEVSA